MQQDSANTLIQVICLLLAVASVSWVIMARPMRVAPKASIRFALANFLVLVGMLLYTQRSDASSYLYWLIADVIILFGFATLRRGAQTLYRLPSSLHIDLTIIVITAAAMLFVPPHADSAPYLVSVLSLSAAIIFYGLARDHYLAFKETMTSFATYWLVVPILIISVLFTSRTFILILLPEHIDTFATLNTEQAKPILWAYIAFILVVNILIVGNSINKLVTKIMTIANVDALTGVWNRNYLQRHLAKIHQRWLNTKEVYSVILFDLDHFKLINDTYGHGVGDSVLQQTAQALGLEIQKHDIFCRFGGEEFLIILPNTDQQQARIVAERCHQVLTNFQVQTDSKVIKVTASFGIATIQPNLSTDNLLSLADNAMYEAKGAGRNCIKLAA
ncbi:GGDEF domain-containing protein [Shewanella maritima]|uniref:GGDEF domain-containing protein n=1 Tax=Shewanella maritima TaxID=2520507 RepID=UPI00373563CB